MSEDKQDRNLAYAVHYVEREFGITINEDYSYFKFLSQLDYLNYVNKEQEKSYNKSRIKGRRR